MVGILDSNCIISILLLISILLKEKNGLPSIGEFHILMENVKLQSVQSKRRLLATMVCAKYINCALSQWSNKIWSGIEINLQYSIWVKLNLQLFHWSHSISYIFSWMMLLKIIIFQQRSFTIPFADGIVNATTIYATLTAYFTGHIIRFFLRQWMRLMIML